MNNLKPDIPLPYPHVNTLVVGCDASGKSTMLNAIHDAYGDEIIEVTSTEESRKFKTDHLQTLIDANFINKRENLYLKLGSKVLKYFSHDAGQSVVTTSSDLVTYVSHDTMRSIVSSQKQDDRKIIEHWLEVNEINQIKNPDIVVHTFTDFNVIHDRILQRQLDGETGEKFWGFNSPFYLSLYQERWREVVSKLPQYAIKAISIDTSTTSVNESIGIYTNERNGLQETIKPQ